MQGKEDMSKFYSEKQGADNYLVYRLGEGETLDSMSLGMITNNRIPGLVEISYMQMDGVEQLRYHVSSKIPVSRIWEETINKKRLLGIFGGILDGLSSAEDYMLEQSSILLHPNYIFVDARTGEVGMICLPVQGTGREHTTLPMLFKGMMFQGRFDQKENCDYVTQIINYLNGSGVFSADAFRRLLTQIEDRSEKAAQVQNAGAGNSGKPNLSTGTRGEGMAYGYGNGNRAAGTESAYHPAGAAGMPGAGSAAAAEREAVPISIPTPETAQKQEDDGRQGGVLHRLFHKKEKEPPKSKKQKKSAQSQILGGMQIPGQAAQPQSAGGMQIPGQTAQPQSAGGMQIPGQAAQPQSAAGMPGAGIPQTPPHPAGMTEADFGDTVYAGFSDESEETVMMDPGAPGSAVNPYLLHKRNGERVMLNRPVTRIGRKSENNDYAVTENSFVGKMHCHVLMRNGEYFLVDDNSKNHTYVDGAMIAPGCEVKLIHGQVIRLADEEFEFHVF